MADKKVEQLAALTVVLSAAKMVDWKAASMVEKRAVSSVEQTVEKMACVRAV